MSKTGLVGFGPGYTASDAMKAIQESERTATGERTWGKLYSGIDIAEQQALGQLERNYMSEVSEAYSAYYRGQQALASDESIAPEAAVTLQDINEQTLQEAYQSYMQSYQQNVASVQENMAAYRQSLTSELQTKAEYTAQTYNYLYPYLQNLVTKQFQAQGYDSSANLLKKNDLYRNRWGRYFTEEGQLISQEEFYDLIANNPDVYDQLFNEEATYGQSAFSFVEGGKPYSFQDYLQEDFETLSESEQVKQQGYFDWLRTENPYNALATNNYQSILQYAGANDYTYSFLERAFGMNKEQITEMFDRYRDKAESVSKSIASGKAKGITTLTSSIKNVSDDLGITAQISDALKETLSSQALGLGMTEREISSVDGWTLLEQVMDKYSTSLASGGVQAGKFFADLFGSGIVGAGSGAMVGGVPGAIVGSIIGGIAGVIEGSLDISKKRKTNKAIAKRATDAYAKVIAAMETYSQSIVQSK